MGNYTTDLKQATSGTGTLFTDADNVWGNGSDVRPRLRRRRRALRRRRRRSTTTRTSTAATASSTTAPAPARRVHYGNNYDNAFWDGTQMTYGDGAGNTQPAGRARRRRPRDEPRRHREHRRPDLLRRVRRPERGDQRHLRHRWWSSTPTTPSDPGDYLIGEKIDINGNGTPLRYMDKPSQGRRVAQDCWSSGARQPRRALLLGRGEPLLLPVSEGRGAKTINGVATTARPATAPRSTGIGRDAAAKIWYRALTVYMTSSTNYAGARTAAIKAAKDLYGATSAECTGVARVLGDRGPGRRDLRRHHAAAHREQPAGQPRLRVRRRPAGPAPPARSPTTPGARRTPAAGRRGWAATARPRPRTSPSR